MQTRWHANSTRYRAAAAGALREFRAELRPHDPFEVDAERAAAGMRVAWGGLYAIKPCRGGFEAGRRHGPRVSLTAETPDDLTRAMLADWSSW